MTSRLDLLYGKTREEVQALVDQVFSHKALVLDKEGLGGSGVMVSVGGPRRGVLTARHVVLDCLLSGALTAERSNRPGVQTIKPSQILCLGFYDSAVLVLRSEEPPGPCLDQAVWMNTSFALRDRDPVLVLGTPGGRKEVDLSSQRIQSEALPYLTHVLGEVQGERPFVCEIDDNPALPETLGGMSGGPVCGADGRFLGILMEEQKGTLRQVKVLPTPCLGAYRRRLGQAQKVRYRICSKDVAVEYRAVHRDGRETRVRALADLHEPLDPAIPGEPAHRSGLGRLLGIQVLVPEEASFYPLATDVCFKWNHGDPGATWLEPLGEAVARMLGAGGLSVVTVAPDVVPAPDFLGKLKK